MPFYSFSSCAHILTVISVGMHQRFAIVPLARASDDQDKCLG